METFQKLYFTLTYDIETFKNILACKSSWYKQLVENTTYPLNLPSVVDKSTRVKNSAKCQLRLEDIRELNEGVLKYQPFDESVEITDRMLFLGAHRPIDRENVLIERIRQSSRRGGEYVDDREAEKMFRTLHLEITPDIRDLVGGKNNPSFLCLQSIL